MLSYIERGRLGSKFLWSKYKSDKEFRDKLINKWRKTRIQNYEKSLNYYSKIRINKREMEILKSELCGFLAADGSVFIRKESKTGKIHYEIRFYPDDFSLVEAFKKNFERLYFKKVHIKQNKNFFSLSISNKFAVKDLLSIANFTSKNWTLPKILKSKKAKIEWLRAYFDCDGHVSKHSIIVQSVNKKGIIEIQKLLKEFYITSKIYTYKRKQKNWNVNYILSINRKEMRQRFLNTIGLNHKLKRIKLENYLKAEVA